MIIKSLIITSNEPRIIYNCIHDYVSSYLPFGSFNQDYYEMDKWNDENEEI